MHDDTSSRTRNKKIYIKSWAYRCILCFPLRQCFSADLGIDFPLNSAMQQTHVQLLFSYPVEGVVGGQIIVPKGSLIGRAAARSLPISLWRCPDRHQFKGKAWQTIVGFGVRRFWDNPKLWPHADSAYSLQCRDQLNVYRDEHRLFIYIFQCWTAETRCLDRLLNCWLRTSSGSFESEVRISGMSWISSNSWKNDSGITTQQQQPVRHAGKIQLPTQLTRGTLPINSEGHSQVIHSSFTFVPLSVFCIV